jgi:plastocyanin
LLITMNHNIAVAVGLAAVLAAALAPISTFKPAFAAEVVADIVVGSSTKTTDAFTPNPLNVNVGDTVTWTNKDTTTHTVTSGTGPNDPNKGKEFDSSPNLNPIIVPNAKFSHTFETAGEFPYFCALHTGMVGTIIVSESSEPEPEPTAEETEVTSAREFSVIAAIDDAEYEIMGRGDAVATAATINPNESVEIEFDGSGAVELTLPTDMIDGISAVQVGTETILYQVMNNGTTTAGEEDASTTISFEVPEGETTVTIQGASVVPEFPVIAAILAASIAGIIGYTRFARNGTGFFGRA